MIILYDSYYNMLKLLKKKTSVELTLELMRKLFIRNPTKQYNTI